MNYKSFVLVALLAGCGTSDGVDTSGRDPRCVSACPETMPAYDGVGRICNAASREQCLDECEVRIAGVSPVCQSCLIEESCFSPGGDGCSGDDISLGCTQTTCTAYGEFGMCMYPVGDEAAKLKCYQQVDPRREVACTPEFRPTTECESVCQ